MYKERKKVPEIKAAIDAKYARYGPWL